MYMYVFATIIQINLIAKVLINIYLTKLFAKKV